MAVTIETGTYLERIFPQIGLRFIAIKEHYDNFWMDGSNESLMIPLQNMINALYRRMSHGKLPHRFESNRWSKGPSSEKSSYGLLMVEDHTNMVWI